MKISPKVAAACWQTGDVEMPTDIAGHTLVLIAPSTNGLPMEASSGLI